MVKDKEIRPAIVAIGYNRPEALKRLLYYLENAKYDYDDIDLIISLDYEESGKTLNVANDARWSHGRKQIRQFDEKQGLKNHLFSCADYSEDYGAVIMFEDDVLPAPYFYDYVIQALSFYHNDDKVLGIALFSQIGDSIVLDDYDTYMWKNLETWGQCIVGSIWHQFREWYDKNTELTYNPNIPDAVYQWKDAWSKYVIYFMNEKDKYFVVPYYSLSYNFQNRGVHTQAYESIRCPRLFLKKKKYNFPEFAQATVYDSFNENIKFREDVSKKYNKKVCIDYKGNRSSYDGYDLCISRKRLPYKVIKKWGLRLKPFELNYYYNIQGEDLFLYDLIIPRKKKRAKWNCYERLLIYDYGNISRKDKVVMLVYSLKCIIGKIKGNN